MSARAMAAVALAACALAAPPAAATHGLRDFDVASLEALKAQYRGRPFVLAMWSVHCEPCARDMPVWKSLHRRFPLVEVVLVATDPPVQRERVVRFLRRHDPGSVQRWAYAGDDEVRIRFAIDPRWRGELPRTYLFDAAHRAEVVTGALEASMLEGWFAAASKKPPG